MLMTIQAYARERLDERRARPDPGPPRSRLLDLVERIEPGLHRRASPVVDRLEHDHDNIRAGLSTGSATRPTWSAPNDWSPPSGASGRPADTSCEARGRTSASSAGWTDEGREGRVIRVSRLHALAAAGGRVPAGGPRVDARHYREALAGARTLGDSPGARRGALQHVVRTGRGVRYGHRHDVVDAMAGQEAARGEPPAVPRGRRSPASPRRSGSSPSCARTAASTRPRTPSTPRRSPCSTSSATGSVPDGRTTRAATAGTSSAGGMMPGPISPRRCGCSTRPAM
jgi:hypothetical protein